MSLIFAINPGATSTKVGLFEDDRCVAQHTAQHAFDALPSLIQQIPMRRKVLEEFLKHNLGPGDTLDAVVGRGGLLPPMPAGVYTITDKMLDFLARAPRGSHASNLGAPLASAIAQAHNVPAFVVDPVTTDELEPVARISGLKGIERRSICHALNIRAVAHRYAQDLARPFESLRIIVVHMGSGTSMAAICNGRLIDVVNPLDEGPFGMDRPGSLPSYALLDLCLPDGTQRAAKRSDIESKLLGNGGIYSYLHTRDLRDVLAQASDGDQTAQLLIDALAYNTAKWIGAMATVLEGKVDAIILTGGMAHSQPVVRAILSRIAWIAPTIVYPGEDELRAMVEGVFRVFNGQETARVFRFV